VPSGVRSETTVIVRAELDGATRAAVGSRTSAQRERPSRSLRTVVSPGAEAAPGASAVTAATASRAAEMSVLFMVL
jgi:hypothetical protein